MKITKKIENDHMTGKIVFTMLPYQKRVELVKEVYLSNHKIAEDDTNAQTEEQLEIGVGVNAIVAQQVNHVEIKYKDSDIEMEINSIEELGMFQEGVVIINEIGSIILNGYIMGNEKVKESNTQSPSDGTVQS